MAINPPIVEVVPPGSTQAIVRELQPNTTYTVYIYLGLANVYPSSLAGGNSPGECGTGDFASAGTGTIYIRHPFQSSSTLTTNGNTDIKLWEPHTFQEGASSGEENHILAIWAEISNTQLVPLIGLQGPYAASNIHATNKIIVTDGAEHIVEWLLVQDSPAGAGNGTAQVWVDGTLIINATGVLWLGTGNTSGWKALVCDPTYGGGTATPPNVIPPVSWWFRYLYISVK
jgi:hypothetical protein